MPTYAYQCDACQHEFDEFQSIKDDPLKTCPQCKEDRLRRLFGTGAALLFKGSGFYSTDYRSEAYKAAAKADGTTGKADGKSESDGAGGGKKTAADSSKAGAQSDR
jgi:putative FmdB family regulatory protein